MLEKNPWKTLGSKLVYKNPWIRVREDQVIRPDGHEGIYGVIETKIATGVVAVTTNLEIYLVGQYRYPTQEYSWEIIEGGADNGEEPLDAAKRELQEEAGLIAAEWSQLGGEIHLSNCFSAEIGLIYLAGNLTHTESSPDGTEILQIKKIPFPEALRMTYNGEIKDAMSVIAITRAEKLFRENNLA